MHENKFSVEYVSATTGSAINLTLGHLWNNSLSEQMISCQRCNKNSNIWSQNTSRSTTMSLSYFFILLWVHNCGSISNVYICLEVYTNKCKRERGIGLSSAVARRAPLLYSLFPLVVYRVWPLIDAAGCFFLFFFLLVISGSMARGNRFKSNELCSTFK